MLSAHIRNQAAQVESWPVHNRITRNGHLTAAHQTTIQGPLSPDTDRGLRVVQRGNELVDRLVFRAALNPQGALPNGGKALLWRQNRADTPLETKPFQARGRQNDGVLLSSIQL
jgi:hypothetical protein